MNRLIDQFTDHKTLSHGTNCCNAAQQLIEAEVVEREVHNTTNLDFCEWISEKFQNENPKHPENNASSGKDPKLKIVL